jgi:hypothetical protein
MRAALRHPRSIGQGSRVECSEQAVKCNGLESDRQVEHEEVNYVIENKFCPEVGCSLDLRTEVSAISRVSNHDTPNKSGDSTSDRLKIPNGFG